jgi:hypothetical protein
MKDVLISIERRSRELDGAPLFRFVSDSRLDPRRRLGYAPCLAHFVMTFADLYELVFRDEPAQDRFQQIVNAHTYEDGGHWKWFLADLPKLGCDGALPFSQALRLIWGPHNVNLRRLSYHICRLALGASSLHKLVLVHCIESAGKVSLRHVARAAQELTARTGKPLTYFGAHHFETESQHTLEQDHVSALLADVALSPELSSELSSLVAQTFDLFTGFAEDLLAFALGTGDAPSGDPAAQATQVLP